MTTMRADLTVRFHEKDEVKSLGAEWDPAARVWYVPAGMDPRPFARWLPEAPPAEPGRTNLRSETFGLSFAEALCWKCAQKHPVARILAQNPDHYWEDEWERYEGLVALTFVSALTPEACAVLRQHAPWMGLLRSKAGGEYWANACEHCGALAGDHYLGEPDAPFFPTSPEAAALIKSTWFDVPFEAACGSVTLDPSWLDA